ncbi:MAG: ChrR family anti-sigma-E factor [Colwellia sp.]|nr:ChrR family anti-sigma-E factor [Colwellia sp.]
MIKHHPKFELLQSFVNGELPASLSAGIAIHADMCPVCQEKISQLTEQLSYASFEEVTLDRFIVEEADTLQNADDVSFEQAIAAITESSDIDIIEPKIEKNITFKDQVYSLPSLLNNMVLGKTANIGKLARARIQLDENEIHSSLLHIEPGGSVPEHTHNGFELTVLIAGTFSDEAGEYEAGDFIMLDKQHQHHPISEKGCLCFTVANDSLHFTQGINKLLNPIGTFIY